MGSEIIDRGAEEITVTLGKGAHDALSTDLGIVRNIRKIILGNGEAGLSDGEMYIHIDGDATKVCVSELSYNSTFVTAIAFADLTSGLIRIGHDPQSGNGSVVLILLMESDMPDSTLARAGITATEAITASVQDLGLAYDGNPASGSVDQTIVTVCSKDSGLYLRGAGKHTKLGELIGRSTIEAVKASAAENGTTMASRASLVDMLGAYGYDQEKLFAMSGCSDYPKFLDRVISKDSDPKVLALVSSIIHVSNEVQWGLLEPEIGMEVGIGLMRVGLREPVRSDDLMDTLALNVALYFMDP